MTTDRNRHLFPPYEDASDAETPATPSGAAAAFPNLTRRAPPGDGPDAPPAPATPDKALQGLKRRQLGKLVTRSKDAPVPVMRPFPRGRHPRELHQLAVAQELERRERLGRPLTTKTQARKAKPERSQQNPPQNPPASSGTTTPKE